MIRPRDIVRKLDDGMNPIAVKELRQAVRSGIVTGGFVIFVVTLLAAMGIYLMDQGTMSADFQGGGEIFRYLAIILVLAATVLLPLHAGSRLAAERGESNADLLFITTLSPGRIVRGKMLAAMLLIVMVYSACAPFVTFTYLLRGVDFPTIFLVIALSFLLSVTSTQLAILVATIPVSAYFRVLMWLVFATLGIVLLPYLFSEKSGFLAKIISGGVKGWDGLWETWPKWGTVLLFGLVLIGLFHVLTVAMLKPPAADKTMNIRIYLTATWLVTGIVAIAWSAKFNRRDPLLLWSDAWWGFLAACMLAAVGERTDWGARIRRKIPTNPALRTGAFVLYTGAAGGLTWVLIMTLLTAGVLWASLAAVTTVGRGSLGRDSEIMLGLTFFAYAYCVTAALLRRYVLRRFLSERHTSVLAIALLCLGCLLPLLAAHLLLTGTRGHGASYIIANTAGWWNAMNPFMLWESRCRNLCLTTAGVWAAVAATLSVPWYLEQLARFRPWRPPPVAVDATETAVPATLPDGLDLVDEDDSNAE